MLQQQDYLIRQEKPVEQIAVVLIYMMLIQQLELMDAILLFIGLMLQAHGQ